jgi:hypothetical protein
MLFLVNAYKTKICVNCKYFIKDDQFVDSDLYGKCSFFPRSKDNEINYLVAGNNVKYVMEYYYCSTDR